VSTSLLVLLLAHWSVRQKLNHASSVQLRRSVRALIGRTLKVRVWDFYTVSGKKIPDIFDCNVKKDYQILIVFDTNISDTTDDQIAVQFSIAPIVCFCTTWGNKTNKILHFYLVSPVSVFTGSAEADIS